MELLAPVGGWDMLRAAVFSGADCVYAGVRGFNARRGAENFGPEELREAVAFCHARGCKLYAALNTLALPGREAELAEAILAVAAAGCDAVIVQDLGAAARVKELAPALPLHASTQMSVHSLEGVRMLADMGFARVILARELCREEIAAIAAQSPIELEVFVHGALCVSVSGQCMMSAFLGGRSANKGGCAGPCRLPFRAECGDLEQDGPARRPAATGCHQLSLKDLSILDALPELAAMGVVSAKIEGRLRGPEYVAVVTDAARKALNGQEYDKDLLQSVFSRSGFTKGWYTGENGAGMFGHRSEADSAAAKAALPKARALYRRERPRVPVNMNLHLNEYGGELVITDGEHTLRGAIPMPLAAAERDAEEALRTALAKTGGTPFYAKDIRVKTGGMFLPAPVAGALRRDLLLQLLALREQLPPVPKPQAAASSTIMLASKREKEEAARVQAARHALGRPLLRVRFEHAADVPENAPALCEELLLPLFEAESVPQSLRAQTRLWLPRVLFGPEEARVAAAVKQAAEMGFAGFEAQNVAHLRRCRGQRVAAGFGLNVTNEAAAAFAACMGADGPITLSPELTLRQLRAVCSGGAYAGGPLEEMLVFDALCYGHLPLMVTRACPLKNAPGCGGCAACPGHGAMVDRKGAAFPVLCRDGARTILNPVPLWMGDRLAELPTGTATLYFTTETKRQAAQVLAAYAAGAAAPGPFTRGLYDRGTED